MKQGLVDEVPAASVEVEVAASKQVEVATTIAEAHEPATSGLVGAKRHWQRDCEVPSLRVVLYTLFRKDEDTYEVACSRGCHSLSRGLCERFLPATERSLASIREEHRRQCQVDRRLEGTADDPPLEEAPRN